MAFGVVMPPGARQSGSTRAAGASCFSRSIGRAQLGAERGEVQHLLPAFWLET